MIAQALWRTRLSEHHSAAPFNLHKEQQNLKWIVFFFGIAMAIRSPAVPLLFFREESQGGFGISPAMMKLLHIVMFFLPRILSPVMGKCVDYWPLWGSHRASYMTVASEGIMLSTLFLALVVYYGGSLAWVVFGYVMLEMLIAFLFVVQTSAVVDHSRQTADRSYNHSIQLWLWIWETCGIAIGAVSTGLAMHFLQNTIDFDESFSDQIRIIPVPHTLPIREVTGVLFFVSTLIILTVVYICASYNAPPRYVSSGNSSPLLPWRQWRCPTREQLHYYIPPLSRRLLFVIGLDSLTPDIDTLRMTYAIQLLHVHMAFPAITVAVESIALIIGISLVHLWHHYGWQFRVNWILCRMIRILVFGVMSMYFYNPNVFSWPAEITLAISIFIDTFAAQSGEASQETVLLKFTPHRDTATGASVLKSISQILRGMNTVITASVLYIANIQPDRYDNVGHYTLGATLVMLVTFILGMFLFTQDIELYVREVQAHQSDSESDNEEEQSESIRGDEEISC